MLPFSILPIILIFGFLLVWSFIGWLKFREHIHAMRQTEHEARSHVVSVRKMGHRRPRVDHAPG
jgi:hypothetical protein